jgi:acetyl-CoA carboxylase carboxyltransferase component
MGAIGTGTLGQDPAQFIRLREIPYVAAVLGPSFGTACWFSMLSDFVVMRKGALLAISSPKVTSIAISQKIEPEDLAGWKMQSEVTGKVDRVVEGDEEALDLIKAFLATRRHRRQTSRPGPTTRPATSLISSRRIAARFTMSARSFRRSPTKAAISH